MKAGVVVSARNSAMVRRWRDRLQWRSAPVLGRSNVRVPAALEKSDDGVACCARGCSSSHGSSRGKRGGDGGEKSCVRSAMFIAKPTAETTKLRRSGMYSSQLNRQAQGSCRSYGAWMSLWIARYYKHGAPNGAWAFSPVDDACNVQRGRAHSAAGDSTPFAVIAIRGLLVALLLGESSLALHGGTLTGTFTPIASGSNVDLTATGKLDWVHWGLYTDSSIDRKGSVTPSISDFSLIGDANCSNCFLAAYQYTDKSNWKCLKLQGFGPACSRFR
jgi:hypothetical protein